MRLTLLDGFRGYFLLFMMIAHTNALVQAPIGRLTHHTIGWVEDAQGFVFLSGLVVGLVYSGRMVRRGFKAMRQSLMQRVRKIYAYQATIILFLLALSIALTLVPFATPPWMLQQYVDDPIAFTLLSLTLVTGAIHLGILPMYIFFMLVTPLLLRLFAAGQWPLVLMTSVLLWLLAQTGLPDLAQWPFEEALRQLGRDLNIGIYFNVFGWQVLYVSGLYAGWLLATERLDLDWFRDPKIVPAVKVGFIGFLGLAVFSLAVEFRWLGDDFSAMTWRIADRGNFAPLYAVAFFLDLFLVVWLLVAGRNCGNVWVERASALLEWLMTRPALTFLGRHSLQVFVAHVLAVYLLVSWLDGREIGTMAANLIVLLCPLPLYAAAWFHAEYRRGSGPRARAA